MLNPAGWFAYLVWGMPEFNYTIWAWHIAVPLELGLLFAMMFIREGGLGLRGVMGITLICIFAACTGTAPFYTLITWAAQQVGVSVSAMGLLEIYSWEAAIAHTGTHVRAPRRRTPTASPSKPPQAPAA